MKVEVSFHFQDLFFILFLGVYSVNGGKHLFSQLVFFHFFSSFCLSLTHFPQAIFFYFLSFFRFGTSSGSFVCFLFLLIAMIMFMVQQFCILKLVLFYNIPFFMVFTCAWLTFSFSHLRLPHLALPCVQLFFSYCHFKFQSSVVCLVTSHLCLQLFFLQNDFFVTLYGFIIQRLPQQSVHTTDF